MRRISLILLTLTACELSTKDGFQGSWYRCDYLGQYSELHISEDELIYNWIFPNGWHEPLEFQIINDTLVSIDTLHNWHNERGNPGIVKTQAVLIDNQLTFLYGNLDSMYYESTFDRIQFELETYSKNDSIQHHEWLNKQFYERARFFNCQDQRTEEERNLDSLELQRLIEDLGNIF